MTLTITLDDKYEPAFAKRATVDETPEIIAGGIVAQQFDAYLAIDAEDTRAALAANAALVDIGLEVNSASPEKQAAAIAAARAVLNS